MGTSLRVLAALLSWAPALAAAQSAPPGKPEPGRAGTVVTSTTQGLDKVADEAGQIYVTRGYKGVVPGVRDEPAVPSKTATPATPPATVEWIGFQPFATYSRVFVQVEGKYSFTVTRPRPDRIEIRLPDARISSENDLRQLETRAFPTAVDQVTVESVPGAVLVVVHLKKAVGYLYRSEGRYVFVDVEP